MLIERDVDDFAMLGWLDEYMVGHKGFIAGGCFKNILSGQSAKDIDIFFENEEDFYEAEMYFDRQTPTYEGPDKLNARYRFLYESKNAKGYIDIDRKVRIELCHKVYGSAKDIVSKFDFTITKFAYYKVMVEDETVAEDIFGDGDNTHVEYRVLMDDRFFEHLHLKRVVTDDQILYPAATFERMIRYGKYGYFPCRETKMKIIKALREADERQIELSDSLYDGLD